MNRHPAVAVSGILALAVLEGVALITGLDGALFMPVVVAIAGIAGYALPHKRA